MAIDWRGSQVTTDRITERMFGTNMLFDRDRVGPDGTFDDSLDLLSMRNVRYPGGSITEWYFDILNPDASRVWAVDRDDWREIMPLTEFLTWAGAADIGVHLVIPTGSLMADGAAGTRQPRASAFDDVYGYVTDVLSGVYGDARIDTFEIGNEYWLGAELNVTEYARIANLIAEATQKAIDDHRDRAGLGADWEEPLIAIQRGQYGQFSPETNGYLQNKQLIASLTDEAADAVDAVVAHYYTWDDWSEIGDFGYHFDALDAWAADPRMADIEYHVTEWNVNNFKWTELGLKQVGALWFMAAEMLNRGVDAAHVWPIQQNNHTNLSGDEGQVALTVAGEGYRLLSEVAVGTRLTRRTEWEDGVAWVYEDGDSTHVFIASRSGTPERFVLDTADLGVEGQTWWKARLGVAGDAATDDPDATPQIEIRADTAPQKRLGFDLGAFEVVRVSFHDTLGDGPGDAFPVALTGTVSGDAIVASAHGNTLRGLWGDDTLTGGAGQDVILAGDGADRVTAGGGRDLVDLGAGDDVFVDDAQGGPEGADKVFGGDGDDRIEARGGGDSVSGQGGDDTISGGGGGDSLFGDAGDDRIWGGTGDDEAAGGDGADEVHGGHGDDTRHGGAGADTLRGDAGDDTVAGGDGADDIGGWDGHDLLSGGGGDDTLAGGDGRDTLIGGDGDDVLRGQAGADTFVFDRDDGHDIIDGFDAQDMIDLRGRGIAFDELRIDSAGNAATLHIAGTVVEVRGLTTDLDADHFLFG